MAAACIACDSLRMSMRHPVSLAASLAFCPSLPNGERKLVVRNNDLSGEVRRVHDHLFDPGRAYSVGHKLSGVFLPLDDVDFFTAELAYYHANA